MATKTERTTLMKRFGEWLKEQSKTQKWAGPLLNVYPGYLSNLVTGKQVASEEVCQKASELMRLGRLPPNKTAEVKKAAKVKVKKKIAKLRTAPAKPEDLPFKRPPPSKAAQTIKKLVRKPKIVEPAPHLRLARAVARRRPTPAEVKAVGDLVVTCIKIMPGMTVDQLVEVTDAVMSEVVR